MKNKHVMFAIRVDETFNDKVETIMNYYNEGLSIKMNKTTTIELLVEKEYKRIAKTSQNKG